MSLSVRLDIGQAPAPDALYSAIADLEVEECSDQPSTLVLRLPVNRVSAGDLQFVGDGTFEPGTNIAITVTPAGPGAASQCVFDGYVLSWRLHLDRAAVSSTVEIWAQDASWLMNLDDHVFEWSGQTDGEVASAIFSGYGFRPAAANTANDSPRHAPDGHTLLQRATDLQFLRGLARRGGKLCRVACTDTPGARTGYFVTPAVDGQPAATISLTDPDSWTVDALDFDWDVMRPTEVDAGQVDLTAAGPGTEVSADDSGLRVLGARGYPAYLGRSSSLLLTAPADVPELSQRTAAVLAESGFFSRCTGEADSERIGAILRAGDVVTIQGAGSLQSGNWLVWKVRHSYSLDAWKMAFTLVRNAVGPTSPGGGLASFAAALPGAGSP